MEKALNILLQSSGDDVANKPGQYAVVLEHAEHLAVQNKNADVAGRAKFVAKLLQSLKFVFFCHFLLDMLSVVAKLSKTLQNDNKTLPSAVAAIHGCLVETENLQVRPRPNGHLKSFLECVQSQPEGESESVCFQGTELKGSCGDIDVMDFSTLPLSYTKAIRDSVKEAVSGLTERFSVLLGSSTSTDQSAKVVASLRIFNPDIWPDDCSSLSSYGEDELQTLTNWYSHRLERKGCRTEAILHQWLLFKKLVQREFKDKSFLGLYAVMISREPYKTDFNDLLYLVEIKLILPVTSASCERIFSSLKRIKTDSRSALHVDTMEDLIRISIANISIEDFAPQPAVLKWMMSVAFPSVVCFGQVPTSLCDLNQSSDCNDQCCAGQ